MRTVLLVGFTCGFLWGGLQQDDHRDLRGRIGPLLNDGRVADAERLLREELAKHPQSAELHAQLGMLYYQVKRYEQAIEELGRAVQLNGTNAEYTMNLAEVLLASRRFPVAVDFLLGIKQGSLRFRSISTISVLLTMVFAISQRLWSTFEMRRN